MYHLEIQNHFRKPLREPNNKSQSSFPYTQIKASLPESNQKGNRNVKSILYITLLIALQFTKYTEKHFCKTHFLAFRGMNALWSKTLISSISKQDFQILNKVNLLHKATTLVELLGSWSARQTQTKIHEEPRKDTHSQLSRSLRLHLPFVLQ